MHDSMEGYDVDNYSSPKYPCYIINLQSCLFHEITIQWSSEFRISGPTDWKWFAKTCSNEGRHFRYGWRRRRGGLYQWWKWLSLHFRPSDFQRQQQHSDPAKVFQQPGPKAAGEAHLSLLHVWRRRGAGHTKGRPPSSQAGMGRAHCHHWRSSLGQSQGRLSRYAYTPRQ